MLNFARKGNVTVNGLGGSDTMNFTATTVLTTILGGGGADTIRVGNASDGLDDIAGALTVDGGGQTALHYAVDKDPAVIGALLAAHADVAARTNGGDTPLHRATNHRSVANVRALLAAGSPVDARNGRGETSLFEAARKKGVKRVVFASSNHAVGF